LIAESVCVFLLTEFGALCTGTVKARATKELHKKQDDSFPFNPLSSSEEKTVPPGWFRRCFQHLKARVDGVSLSAVMVALQWKDSKIVNFLSTAYNSEPVENTDVQRNRRGGKTVSFQGLEEQQMYSENMGAVDRFDQKMAAFSIGIGSSRWYLNLVRKSNKRNKRKKK
jgi:hypothetical protein